MFSTVEVWCSCCGSVLSVVHDIWCSCCGSVLSVIHDVWCSCCESVVSMLWQCFLQLKLVVHAVEVCFL